MHGVVSVVAAVAVICLTVFVPAVRPSCVPVSSSMRTFGHADKGISVSTEETLLYNTTTATGGVVTLMWFTGELLWPTFGETRIRVYVDNETEASLSFQVLMAVGMSQPTLTPWGESKLGNVALSGGVYFTYRIPFSHSLRVTAQLPSHMIVSGNKSFYFIIRGMTNYPVTVGDLLLPSNARLKLRTLENYEGQPYEEVVIYNATGAGALLQTTFYGISSNLHYLEGEVRSVIDGQDVKLSSGTEDYFLSGQYFDLGAFHTPISGCTHMDRFVNHSFAAYKVFEEDPVLWTDSFQLTWRIGEDRGIVPNVTNITTYVWAYEW